MGNLIPAISILVAAVESQIIYSDHVSGLGISQPELSEWDRVALIRIAQHLDNKSPGSPVLIWYQVSRAISQSVLADLACFGPNYTNLIHDGVVASSLVIIFTLQSSVASYVPLSQTH
jgi:hypothetical protein